MIWLLLLALAWLLAAGLLALSIGRAADKRDEEPHPVPHYAPSCAHGCSCPLCSTRPFCAACGRLKKRVPA